MVFWNIREGIVNTVARRKFKPVFQRVFPNRICKSCDASVRPPLLPYWVGERFNETRERVLFVGKSHRDEPGTTLPSRIMMDATEFVPDLWEKRWPYWRYTRDIAESLYGPEGRDFVALTNLIKCTNVEDGSTDRTTYQMADCCVLQLGAIWKEIELLQPATIVFYTHRLFPDVLETIPVALTGSIRHVHPQDYSKPCGKKELGWWERTCKTAWSKRVRILVTSHPERKARQEFVRSLTDWIRVR